MDLTRKQVIEELKAILEMQYWNVPLSKAALDVAIGALEHPEKNVVAVVPCGDCISRADVRSLIVKTDRQYMFGMSGKAFQDLYKGIDELPSVEPKAKTGHWIIKDGKEQGYDIAGVKTWYIQIMCSECGFIKTAIEGHTGQYHYCPNCGAKMQEVEDGNK